MASRAAVPGFGQPEQAVKLERARPCFQYGPVARIQMFIRFQFQNSFKSTSNFQILLKIPLLSKIHEVTSIIHLNLRSIKENYKT
jgi:hypothetical protein